MPESLAKSAPPLVFGRCFEPGRLHDQMLSEAYEFLVSEPGPARSATARPHRCRAGKADGHASVCVPSSQGVCA